MAAAKEIGIDTAVVAEPDGIFTLKEEHENGTEGNSWRLRTHSHQDSPGVLGSIWWGTAKIFTPSFGFGSLGISPKLWKP